MEALLEREEVRQQLLKSASCPYLLVIRSLYRSPFRRRGVLDACGILIAAGVPVEGHPQARMTPLMAALHARMPLVAQLLIDHGAEIDALRTCSPLGVCAEACDPEGVRWCLEQGADPGLVDTEGLTALDRAQASSRVEGRAETIALLRAAARP